MTDLAKVRALAVQIVAEIDAVPAPGPVPIPDRVPTPDPVPAPVPVPTPTPVPPANITIRAELLAAIANGASLVLPAGDYGDLLISGKSSLTIRSADPANPARFTTISATTCAGLTLDGVAIKGGDGSRLNTTLRLTGCAGAIVKGCDIEGDISGGGPESYPIYALKCTNLALDHNAVRGGLRAIMLVDCDGITALNQICSQYRSVAIGGGGNNDLTIDGLVTMNARSNSWPKGDHGDFIHLWTDDKRGPARNTIIRNSDLRDGAGNPLMGISLQNKGGFYFDGVTIDNNLFFGANAQALRLDGVRNAAVTRNAFVPSKQKQNVLVGGVGPTHVGGKMMAQGEAKILVSGAQNVTIDGNIFGDLPKAVGVTVGKNLKITFADLVRVFANPSGQNRADFIALANGPGAGLGIH